MVPYILSTGLTSRKLLCPGKAQQEPEVSFRTQVLSGQGLLSLGPEGAGLLDRGRPWETLAFLFLGSTVFVELHDSTSAAARLKEQQPLGDGG